jgi:uncharacterized membrane protein YedE/YeeE
MHLLPYLVLGAAFGAVLVEAEVVSWFRVQEMFRFQAFHMYGVLASAVATAWLSLLGLRRLGLRDAAGAPLCLPPKQLGSGVRYLVGGTIFGVGWALTGACPGPVAALIGAGVPVMVVVLAAALAGTWTYAYLRPRLPH